jgi:hypothetical protein
MNQEKSERGAHGTHGIHRRRKRLGVFDHGFHEYTRIGEKELLAGWIGTKAL